ncbi:hypothetical protein HDU91_002477, partial [Kappamyces sp. JEL0680]
MLWLWVVLGSSTAAQAVNTTSSPCAHTNRLCLEQTAIQNNQSFALFYPFTVIPQDINVATLRVRLYHGQTDAIRFNPCDIPAETQLIASAAVSDPVRTSLVANATFVTFQFTDADLQLAKTDNEFFLHLSDPDSRQCLLGPDINGVFASFIPLDLSARPATPTQSSTALPSTTTGSSTGTTSTGEPTDTPGTNTSSGDGSTGVRTNLLIILLVSGVLVTASLLFV